MTHPWLYFTDPVLRAPTIGSMLMGFAVALVGTLMFVRKRSLLGEALSHATYPGVTFAIIFAAAFSMEGAIPFFILLFAFFSSLIALRVIDFLQSSLKISSDAALAAVLAGFFGIGVTLASYVQFSHTYYFRNLQAYLYGQAATMTDMHIVIYGLLALLILGIVLLCFKEFQMLAFDRQFAYSHGLRHRRLESVLNILLALAVVIGIRSVGVVLMTAMLIAPAVAARQWTNRLSTMLLFAASFGLLSGFLGNYLSVEISQALHSDPQKRLSLPTGPMIVLIASFIALIALLFSPERGLIMRHLRILTFRFRCLQENLLKALWRSDSDQGVAFDRLTNNRGPLLHFALMRLSAQGWIERGEGSEYHLTEAGKQKGARIVRLHRLWEVYLVNYLGLGKERAHKNAEEIEHILTPELEKELTELLEYPTHDPHQQPIPEGKCPRC